VATFWTLRRTAALLERRGGGRKGLPALLVFTDPQRTSDLQAAARATPRGGALVYRGFGAPDAEACARGLRAILHARGAKLMVGADAGLAARVGADGVHLPERAAFRAGALKRRRPGWIVTAAAHSPRAARLAAAAGADAAVVSTIFESRSASASPPMGPLRLARLVRGAGLPVYALGGVNDRTAARLKNLQLAGLAAVEGVRT
jgi:thiamine-phosphate pyrophosphorylase